MTNAIDTGHANLYGCDICDIIKILGIRLQVLQRANFNGALCFETVGFEDSFSEDLYEAALNLVHKTGLCLAKKCCKNGEC